MDVDYRGERPHRERQQRHDGRAAVTSHLAWGLGSYCFFNKNPMVVADHAFEVPVTPRVRLRNMVIVSLGGGRGTISHVINETGKAARAGETVQKLVSGPDST